MLQEFFNLMDLPASSVRDLLAGQNPLDQWGSPLSSEHRTSGAKLVSQWTGVDPNSWTGTIAGIGAEVLTDPANLLGGAGMLKKALAARRANAAIKASNAAELGRYGFVNLAASQVPEVIPEIVNPLTGQASRGIPMQNPDDYLTLWHGTPHTWAADEAAGKPHGAFDLSRIQSGEGGQAFGLGAYMSESRKVGKYYRDSLTSGDEPSQEFWGGVTSVDRALQDRGLDKLLHSVESAKSRWLDARQEAEYGDAFLSDLSRNIDWKKLEEYQAFKFKNTDALQNIPQINEVLKGYQRELLRNGVDTPKDLAELLDAGEELQRAQESWISTVTPLQGLLSHSDQASPEVGRFTSDLLGRLPFMEEIGKDGFEGYFADQLKRVPKEFLKPRGNLYELQLPRSAVSGRYMSHADGVAGQTKLVDDFVNRAVVAGSPERLALQDVIYTYERMNRSLWDADAGLVKGSLREALANPRDLSPEDLEGIKNGLLEHLTKNRSNLVDDASTRYLSSKNTLMDTLNRNDIVGRRYPVGQARGNPHPVDQNWVIWNQDVLDQIRVRSVNDERVPFGYVARPERIQHRVRARAVDSSPLTRTHTPQTAPYVSPLDPQFAVGLAAYNVGQQGSFIVE